MRRFIFSFFLNFLYFFSFLVKKEKKIIIILLIISSLDTSNIVSKLMEKENLQRKNTIYKIFSNYSNSHGFTLINVGKVFKNEKLKIMLTEAGAIPYISKQSEIFDIVGLNNNIFANRPVNCKDIDNISPDIIEIDISGLNIFNLNFFANTNPTDFCGFYSKSYLFEKFLNTKNFNMIHEYKKSKIDNHKNSTVNVAPNNVVFCLLNNNNYSLVFNNKIKPDQFYFLKNKNYKKIKNSCNIENSGYFIDLIKRY